MEEPRARDPAAAGQITPRPDASPEGGDKATEPQDRYYATRLRQLAHLDLDERQAAELWQQVTRHRRFLNARLGRDVGQRVALLDYVHNIRHQLVEPAIVETPTLRAMERDALIDPVTGLYNRRHFDAALQREAERSGRYGAPTSLLLFDLDGFKAVNDKYGHVVGDQVLRAVGTRARQHLRATDVPCRYGGDEFAVVLSDTPLADALSVASRIGLDVAMYFRRHHIAGRELPVTVSGGVATVAPGATTPAELVAVADRALYAAKADGGNRILGPITG